MKLSGLTCAVLALVLAMAAAPARAQDDGSRAEASTSLVQRWTGEDGLGQNSVHGLAQTPEGFIWIATSAGLLRFDGVGFERYLKRDHPALPDDQILALKVDRRGRLWVGTTQGMVYFEKSRFRPIPNADLGGGLEKIVIGPEGAVWAVRGCNGLSVIQGQLPSVLEGRYRCVHDLVIGQDGAAWLIVEGKTGREVKRLPKGARSPVPVTLIGETNANALVERVDGSMLIGTETGLQQWRAGRISAVELPGVESYGVERLFEGRAGRVWVGTTKRGALHLDEGLGPLPVPETMPRDLLVAVYLDKGGNDWLGFDRSGLLRLSESHIRTIGPSQGVPEGSVAGTFRDSEGGLWITVPCNGAVRLVDGVVEQSVGKNEGMDNTCLWSIAEHPNGEMWFGSWGGGVFRYDRRARKVLGAFDESTGLAGVVLAVVSEGERLWFGTDQGVFVMEDGALSRPAGLEASRSSVHHLRRDAKGVMWIGTHEGLVRYEQSRAQVLGKAEGLVKGDVRHTASDGRGGLLVADYGGGLHHYDGERFRLLGKEVGIPNAFVSRISTDQSGYVWVSSNNGLLRFSRARLHETLASQQSLHPLLLSARDGLPSTECNGGNQSSGFIDPEGKLHVPTLDGLGVIDTAAISREGRETPRVLVQTFATPARDIPLSEPLSLTPDERAFEISYTAFHFRAPGLLNFRHRLDNGPWEMVGAKRSASFSGLSPGRHTLELAARVGDGPWSQATALHIEAQARWHESIDMRLWPALVVGLVLIVVVRYFRWREKRVQRLVDARTYELEQANKRLEELANEDALTGAASRRRFDDRLELAWNMARRTGTPVSLMMIDVDHFKGFNDRHGHVAGDLCLRHLCERLGAHLPREADLLARYGGEEFAVLMPGTDAPGARLVAERLHEAVRQGPFEKIKAGEPLVVTVSVGVATANPSATEQPRSLIEMADEALYAAKAQGRDRIVESKG